MTYLFGSLRRGAVVLLATSLSCVACLGCSSSDAKENDACTPDDADGIVDEPAVLLLTVTDTEFMPKILATQNTSEITLTLENQGTTPHGFVVDCLPTPNTDGCPMQSCFPSEAKIEPVAPGESTTIVFESPLVEGIYTFRSDVPEDTALAPGQFIIQ
jgi:hypothetical protein